MERALAAARGVPASSLADGEVPVGALVVAADGTILAEAANAPVGENDPSGHAEIRAMRKAAGRAGNYRLGGCVLVVTLEPCLMCAGAIVHARLAGVVYGASDRRAGAVASCLEALDLPFLNHRTWHFGGIKAEACAGLLKAFFEKRR